MDGGSINGGKQWQQRQYRRRRNNRQHLSLLANVNRRLGISGDVAASINQQWRRWRGHQIIEKQ